MTILEAAATIRRHNPALAAAWVANPFNRVNYALAFAAGFGRGEEEDPEPEALAVLAAAYADRDSRRRAMEEEARRAA